MIDSKKSHKDESMRNNFDAKIPIMDHNLSNVNNSLQYLCKITF